MRTHVERFTWLARVLTLVVDEELSPLTEDLRTDDVHFDDVRDGRVGGLRATVAATDRNRAVRRRLLDDGVAETVLGRYVTGGRRGAGGTLLQSKVQQSHVDRLPRFDLDLPRTLGRAAAVAGLRLCSDDGCDVSGRMRHVRMAQTATRLTRVCLHYKTHTTQCRSINQNLLCLTAAHTRFRFENTA